IRIVASPLDEGAHGRLRLALAGAPGGSLRLAGAVESAGARLPGSGGLAEGWGHREAPSLEQAPIRPSSLGAVDSYIGAVSSRGKEDNVGGDRQARGATAAVSST